MDLVVLSFIRKKLFKVSFVLLLGFSEAVLQVQQILYQFVVPKRHCKTSLLALIFTVVVTRGKYLILITQDSCQQSVSVRDVL